MTVSPWAALLPLWAERKVFKLPVSPTSLPVSSFLFCNRNTKHRLIAGHEAVTSFPQKKITKGGKIYLLLMGLSCNWIMWLKPRVRQVICDWFGAMGTFLLPAVYSELGSFSIEVVSMRIICKKPLQVFEAKITCSRVSEHTNPLQIICKQLRGFYIKKRVAIVQTCESYSKSLSLPKSIYICKDIVI